MLPAFGTCMATWNDWIPSGLWDPPEEPSRIPSRSRGGKYSWPYRKWRCWETQSINCQHGSSWHSELSSYLLSRKLREFNLTAGDKKWKVLTCHNLWKKLVHFLKKKSIVYCAATNYSAQKEEHLGFPAKQSWELLENVHILDTAILFSFMKNSHSLEIAALLAWIWNPWWTFWLASLQLMHHEKGEISCKKKVKIWHFTWDAATDFIELFKRKTKKQKSLTIQLSYLSSFWTNILFLHSKAEPPPPQLCLLFVVYFEI